MINLDRYRIKIRNIVNARFSREKISKTEANDRLGDVIKDIYEVGKKGVVVEDVLKCDEDKLAYLAVMYPMLQTLVEEFELEVI